MQFGDVVEGAFPVRSQQPVERLRDTCDANWRIDSSRGARDNSSPYRCLDDVDAPWSTSPSTPVTRHQHATIRVRPRARRPRERWHVASSSITLRTLAAVASPNSPLPLSTRENGCLADAPGRDVAMVIGTVALSARVHFGLLRFAYRLRKRFRRRVNRSEFGHVNHGQ